MKTISTHLRKTLPEPSFILQKPTLLNNRHNITSHFIGKTQLLNSYPLDIYSADQAEEDMYYLTSFLSQ